MKRSKSPRPAETAFADTFQAFEDKPGGKRRSPKRDGKNGQSLLANRHRFAALANMIDSCVTLAHHLDPKGQELEDVMALLRIARQNVVQKQVVQKTA